MKLVIKLDDETYKEVMNRTEFDTLVLGIKLIEAVQNGTPLPKKHGDLIDRDELLADSYPIDDWGGNEVDIVDVITVENAPTIIEADK